MGIESAFPNGRNNENTSGEYQRINSGEEGGNEYYISPEEAKKILNELSKREEAATEELTLEDTVELDRTIVVADSKTPKRISRTGEILGGVPEDLLGMMDGTVQMNGENGFGTEQMKSQVNYSSQDIEGNTNNIEDDEVVELTQEDIIEFDTLSHEKALDAITEILEKDHVSIDGKELDLYNQLGEGAQQLYREMKKSFYRYERELSPNIIKNALDIHIEGLSLDKDGNIKKLYAFGEEENPIELQKVLGRGAFGIVREGVIEIDDGMYHQEKVVVKEVDINIYKNSGIAPLKREIAYLYDYSDGAHSTELKFLVFVNSDNEIVDTIESASKVLMGLEHGGENLKKEPFNEKSLKKEYFALFDNLSKSDIERLIPDDISPESLKDWNNVTELLSEYHELKEGNDIGFNLLTQFDSLNEAYKDDEEKFVQLKAFERKFSDLVEVLSTLKTTLIKSILYKNGNEQHFESVKDSSLNRAQDIGKQLISHFKLLHEKTVSPLIWRDGKPENAFVKLEDQFYFGDYGISQNGFNIDLFIESCEEAGIDANDELEKFYNLINVGLYNSSLSKGPLPSGTYDFLPLEMRMAKGAYNEHSSDINVISRHMDTPYTDYYQGMFIYLSGLFDDSRGIFSDINSNMLPPVIIDGENIIGVIDKYRQITYLDETGKEKCLFPDEFFKMFEIKDTIVETYKNRPTFEEFVVAFEERLSEISGKDFQKAKLKFADLNSRIGQDIAAKDYKATKELLGDSSHLSFARLTNIATETDNSQYSEERQEKLETYNTLSAFLTKYIEDDSHIIDEFLNDLDGDTRHKDDIYRPGMSIDDLIGNINRFFYETSLRGSDFLDYMLKSYKNSAKLNRDDKLLSEKVLYIKKYMQVRASLLT